MTPVRADVLGHRKGNRKNTVVTRHLQDITCILRIKKEILDSFDENAILILCIWNRIHIFTDRMEEKCREQEL